MSERPSRRHGTRQRQGRLSALAATWRRWWAGIKSLVPTWGRKSQTRTTRASRIDEEKITTSPSLPLFDFASNKRGNSRNRTGRLRLNTTGIFKRNRKRNQPVEGTPASAGTRTMHWALIVLTGLSAFAGPVLGSRTYRYLMESEHFKVDEVLVDGNRRLSMEEIRAITGIDSRAHTLATDLDVLTHRLLAHPWVADCDIRRELPDRLFIRITEQTAVAYTVLDTLHVVNRSGEIFAKVAPDDRMELPIFSGLDPSMLDDPEERTEVQADLRAAANLHALYCEMGLQTRFPLSEVRMEDGRSLAIVLSGNGAEIALGEGPYRNKLFQLEWILEHLHRDKKTPEYVLFDADLHAREASREARVIVKPNTPGDTDTYSTVHGQTLALTPTTDSTAAPHHYGSHGSTTP